MDARARQAVWGAGAVVGVSSGASRAGLADRANRLSAARLPSPCATGTGVGTRRRNSSVRVTRSDGGFGPFGAEGNRTGRGQGRISRKERGNMTVLAEPDHLYDRPARDREPRPAPFCVDCHQSVNDHPSGGSRGRTGGNEPREIH